MSLEHIDPHYVITKTARRYKEMLKKPTSSYVSGQELSRQVQALAEVLVSEINDQLLAIENAYASHSE